MGKKSKSKNNKSSPCYHGCITKKDFNYGGHHKILENYDELSSTLEKRLEFMHSNMRLMLETKFDNFLIAHITDDYLKEKNKLLHHHRLCLLVEIRYMAIPQDEGKDVGLDSKYFRNHKKYMRDITTERGRINIMAREIPCVCMKEKKIEANKSMAKFAQCFCCEEEFSKKQMLRCKGCDLAQYCSKACQKKKWPEHKAFCKNITVSSAAASASASIPSSFVEPSDVDADYY